ncbi:MAG: TetR family transcriptional regulator [Acidobacteria bacterium]|nr:TetR family transcriptional regulator [Acidobacteriota bacterium]
MRRSTNAAVSVPARAAIPDVKTRKQQLVREIIWDAATSLFAEKGYDETTVDEIAQAAGVSPRSCFRYFASKSDIMAYSLVSFAEQLIAAIDACPKSWTAREVFHNMMTQVAQDAVNHPRSRRVFGILKNWPEAAAAQSTRMADAQAMVSGAFEKRIPKNGTARLAAAVLGGLAIQMTGVTIRWCIERKQSDVDAAVNETLATFGQLFSSAGRIEPSCRDR